MHTKRGLEVTTDSWDVIDCIDQFHHQILGSGTDAGIILEGAKKHSDNTLIQIYAAAYYLFAQEDRANQMANAYLLAAAHSLASANPREQLLYDAVINWSLCNYNKALLVLDNVMTQYPRDTLALKFMEWLFYCTGQKHHAEYFLRVCARCAADNQDESHFLAIHSFALELCDHYEQARDMAEAAIAMELVTPWAHHTLAHVALLTHDVEGGIKRLSSLQSSWNNILPLLKGHNIWHLALFHLANRNGSDAMKLYPAILGELQDTVLEQIDTISLLWRMDMAGMPHDELLSQIAKHLNKHPFEYYSGFSNAHSIYCLVKTGQKKLADDSLKQMASYASDTATDPLWGEVVVPLCQGVAAFADADYKKAYTLLSPIIDRSPQVGGSDAQVELFAQTYVQVLLKMKQKDKALHYFNQHLSHYQDTVLGEWWFA